MIIIYDYPGQLCNRIWSLLPSIAYGIATKEHVRILNFEEYSSYFENMNKNEFVSFKPLPHLTKILLSLRSRHYIHYTRENIFDKWFNIHFTEGWATKANNLNYILGYSDKIRDIFEFSSNVKAEVDSFFESLDYDIAVGIHIRRGDYKEWEGGAYYYSNQDYSRFINEIQNQLKEKYSKIGFLLCSNENVDLKEFPENCFSVTNSSAIKDLYALSKCSYILGPPSTYSQWASFYGKVPLKLIVSPSEPIELSSFSTIIGLDRFENGQTFSI